MENLVMCSTIGAVKLQQAAKEKDDTGILLKIENKDSVAIKSNITSYATQITQVALNIDGAIATTHPTVFKRFMDGDFAVQRSQNGFAKIACDQTIEQTANRDCKTKGGMVGFTTNKGAVNRWIWSHHARGEITRECELMAGKGERACGSSHLLLARMKQDKSDVSRIIETVNSMVNPSVHYEKVLVNIT
ncbi:hypothetical protein BSL78_19364 [Apostichopus japonicus]|uniref:Uncharacterized protein n=1 Tax=Stichopus japonicus TaxID=307972 RepID=A0A2G8K779_STIJA|nr:hypothetical protein BSL78_19364 [Apostichopus japonicus]